MHSPLENPVWLALSGRQKSLNAGSETLKYFQQDVSPFAGMQKWDEKDLATLQESLPINRNFSVMIAREINIPQGFEVVFSCMLYQMICKKPVYTAGASPEIVLLTQEQVPEMLTLTQLTKPGPFFENTITMGKYFGIFEKGKLAAMAGERLKPEGYTEVSAICTHPDFLGKGYATRLTEYVARQIQDEGLTPFLHVKQDNQRAIDVYKRIGFDVAADVYFAVFKRLE
ncbi:MAG: GNAT family N-acetyltransferase [Chitinophagaceae bacterium]|nr:GNAT family N-acetyltransferase [Chitinophagaceae bacterium]